jgi:hypothetical protein
MQRRRAVKRNLTLLAFVALALLGILPAAAQTDVLVVEGTSVGILDSTPNTTLHVVEPDDTKADRVIVRIEGTDFYPQFEYSNTAAGTANTWRLGVNPSNNFVFNHMADVPVAELRVSPSGQVFVNGTQMNVPDYVFEDGYELMPLDSLREYIEREGHLPNVYTEADRLEQGGVDIATLPLQLLEKVEELTLYTLDQHQKIEDLATQNQQLLDRLAKLEQAQGKKGRR